MRRRIILRADAGHSIGFGHFIRTLALADMLKDEFECVFFTQSPTDYQRAEMASVCRYVELPNDESRFDRFLNYLTGDEVVVLDNYFYNTEYQQRIKTVGCKLVCIDDMHDRHYVADVVINYSPVSESDFDCEPYTRLFLGKEYELLRRPFLQPLRHLSRLNRAVVCLGGSDPLRLTDKIVSLLLQMETSYHITAVLGSESYLSDDNRARVDVRSSLSASQMADLFETSAFGILSTSTVALEAMSRELPILIGYYVENQKEGYLSFERRGNFIPLDYLPILSGVSLREAVEKLNSFVPSKRDYSLIPDLIKQIFRSL